MGLEDESGDADERATFLGLLASIVKLCPEPTGDGLREWLNKRNSTLTPATSPSTEDPDEDSSDGTDLSAAPPPPPLSLALPVDVVEEELEPSEQAPPPPPSDETTEPPTAAVETVEIIQEEEKKSPPKKENTAAIFGDLTHYLINEKVLESSSVDESLPPALLSALIPLATGSLQLGTNDGTDVSFNDLLPILFALARYCSGEDHLNLLRAMVNWLETSKQYLTQKDVIEKLTENVLNGRHQIMLQSTCYMLNYFADLLNAIELLSSSSSAFSAVKSDKRKATNSEIELDPCSGLAHGSLIPFMEAESDWMEDMDMPTDPVEEEDDTSPDESDDDSISKKLCTFTVTQKGFMNQHWYHCHTCRMLDGVGVCTVCARVCHKDHDVTYAKYGSFFCDCGARSDGSCVASTRRVPNSSDDPISRSHPSGLDGTRETVSSSTHGAASSSTGSRLSSYRAIHHGHGSSRKAHSSKGHGDGHHQRHAHQHQSAGLSNLAERIEKDSEAILSIITVPNCCETIMQLLQFLLPAITDSACRASPVGCSIRARGALDELHKADKSFEYSDTLMVPTLGSQEGAFENVRTNFTGEQGNTIRQLMSSNVLRRVGMSVLSSQYGKRQHLAVSHEKGKITLLQLSTLLKQAHSSKRKLTLTRLSSAPVPFTVISISSNFCNDDVLAVCGLKDVHVLIFNQSGIVTGQIALHPHLEAGNYVIKAVWLPGSQTQVAIVTADFVKVYDLAVNATAPQYHFVLPSGKIRDVTFVFSDTNMDGKQNQHLLLISSTGHIYSQWMSDESAASNGPFYMTSQLDVAHPQVVETNGYINGGGVSIYYSHTFQMLFVSYNMGKSFMAPFPQVTHEITHLFILELKGNSAANGGNGNMGSGQGSPSGEVVSLLDTTSPSPSSSTSHGQNGQQALCQWTEPSGHPGLILAMCQHSNNVVVFHIKPDRVVVQEIRFLSSKAKITDMVAVRHLTGGGDTRTTLILLCEDGSLRIYMAAAEIADFWIQAGIRPEDSSRHSTGTAQNTSQSVKWKRRKTTKSHAGGHHSHSRSGSSHISPVLVYQMFPVDFFEHCQHMSDIDFGGSDLLQVYNIQQLKMRLNTTGLYVASTKSAGFTLDITNNDGNMVMCGIRLLVGSQDPNQAPSTIEIFGRTLQLSLTRNRWFDFPFTREESLSADKTITVTFGVSNDVNCVSMVDSIKVYGKSKDNFGWPDEAEEMASSLPASSIVPGIYSQIEQSPSPSATAMMASSISAQSLAHLAPLDHFLLVSLNVINSSFKYLEPRIEEQLKTTLLESGKTMLATPYTPSVHQAVRSLMVSLYPTKSSFYEYRDLALVNHVVEGLENNQGYDGEAFYRFLTIIKSIACTRPHNFIQFIEATFKLKSDSEWQKRFASQDVNSLMSTPLRIGVLPFYDKSDIHKTPLWISSLCAPTVLSGVSTTSAENSPMVSFLFHINEIFWTLYSKQPVNALLSSIALRGLVHAEATVSSLVEIIHVVTLSDVKNVKLAAFLYLQLLLCSNSTVSFAAKQTLVRILRPRPRKRKPFNPTETVMAESTASNSERDTTNIPGQQLPDSQYDILGGAAALTPLLSQLEGEDGDMVQLAIALSLEGAESGNPPPPEMLAAAGFSTHPLPSSSRGTADDPARLSDTTASAVASDDEGSTAATDGSTIRVSPLPQQNVPVEIERRPHAELVQIVDDQSVSETFSNMPSDSCASSLSNLKKEEDVQSESDPVKTTVAESVSQDKLLAVRLELLRYLIECLSQLREPSISGVRVIPVMQVILVLSSDLDGNADETQQALMLNLLSTLLQELSYGLKKVSSLTQRSNANEVKLIIMRLFSILMSRSKSSSSGSSKCYSDVGSSSTTAFCSSITATTLSKSNVMEFCLQILVHLLQFWKGIESDEKDLEEGARPQGNNEQVLLKHRLIGSTPDMSPFFLRQYVKTHANDVFECYPQLLTEMLLRLPYQIAKNVAGSSSSQSSKQVAVIGNLFAPAWTQFLCEYMMIPNLTSYVRKQVRKLLSFMCGSKEKYREVRDFHALESHMQQIRMICRSGGFIESSYPNGPISLNYDSMITLIDHLKACNEIASNRPINWQKFLLQKDLSALPFFLQTSYLINEGVTPIMMLLLQSALCPKATHSSASFSVDLTRSRTKESSLTHETLAQSTQEQYSSELAQQLMKSVDNRILVQFILSFLLDSNSTALRWQAHTFVYYLWKNFSVDQQEVLLNLLWQLWPCLPQYGRKASQFVDLLGYFTLKFNSIDQQKEHEIIEQSLHVLRRQNEIIAQHPNGNLYNSLQSLVEFEGYYLESAPCLVCNNPEVNYSNLKLSSIKVDSRFTTTTQIVKLLGTHTISRIIIRISDIKRSKMVKTFNIYYNNRSVHSVVELKNKFGLWNRARRVVLSPGQSEVKIEFPLPIIACNLMMEYADFYENIQASSETLQCPRCSASVAANPGVCDNCGENVFQCHKCRAINYDEKDPFLCNSCGFCKYAKFDVSLLAKPTCAVDPIENEEDHKKTIANINSLLDKADRFYRSLISNKPVLESLLTRIQDYPLNMDQANMGLVSGTDTAALFNATMALDNRSGAAFVPPLAQGMAPSSQVPPPTGSHVNRSIQQLATRYCQECKCSFDELSRIIQKVTASRRELLDYDNSQREFNTASRRGSVRVTGQRRDSRMITSGQIPAASRCYGCAAATVDHCIVLLKALATVPKYRQLMCIKGVILEIAQHNLRSGSLQTRNEVRQLLCNLTRDNARATSDLNNLLMDKISVAVKSRLGDSWDLAASIRDEMALLACSLDKEDSCWELRLRCVVQLFLMSLKMQSPAVMESLTLPCLRLLRKLIRPQPPSTRRNKDKTSEQLATVQSVGFQVNFHLGQWLNGDTHHSFRAWRQRSVNKTDSHSPISFDSYRSSLWTHNNKKDTHALYLAEKYGSRWREKVKAGKGHDVWRPVTLSLLKNNWLKRIIFNPVSQTARFYGCSLIEELYRAESRRHTIVDLLTSYLCELGSAGECGAEFFRLYHNIIRSDHWKFYLALRGHIHQLGALITREIDQLQQLEEYTLNSYLSQGCALKMLVDLLTVYVDVDEIRHKYKRNLMGFVLDGYLSLRKLLVQRTKLIDDAQETLLELLEEMTSGNEEETSEFMQICVDAVRKCSLDDMQTPLFIFERLCLIIYPEENDSAEFYIILEKDAQQEDFLQGRMVGNPYSSNEPGMGPLMRDVKNKICQDCELVALLEDDSGMELLVNNKIISLDLPVEQVYRKIWCQDALSESAADAMRIIYRMRGLMGDATEEFIETLDTNHETEADEEQLYKMANIMSTCGGIEVMLQRMSIIENLSPRSRSLLIVLLKLFNHCVKVSCNRQKLIQPHLNTVAIMLNVLKLLLINESQEQGQNSSNTSPLEQLLALMEQILLEASHQSPEMYDEFCGSTCGSGSDITFLLRCATGMRNRTNILNALMRVIPFLTLGNENKMLALISNFRPHLDFNKFDFEHNSDDNAQVELFCTLVSAIQQNENGNRLKDVIAQEGIVKNALDYLTLHAPQLKSSLLSSSEEWKEFTGRPALKYVLRILAGLSSGHCNTALLVSTDCIPIIHSLEQVSSDTHVGSLAENLLEAIKQHPSVALKIEEVRRQTKDEKKRLAMVVRQKQLGALGMKTNERGQVTAKTAILNQFEDLAEECGLVCVICREGYKFQPTKVLGIYTFTKRCPLEEYENKSRKTMGYTTVTHFNIVHVDCHMAAVRHARGRDEWESAALQNANTRCNGLLPMWGPQVQESAFASCLARHNTYIQECTGHRDVSYSSCVHDLKHLLLRFALERSFSEESGGGGQESNMHIIPYMIHMALYVINTTRAYGREMKKLTTFLEAPASKWVEQSFEVEGPYYWTLMFSLLNPTRIWQLRKSEFLRRLLYTQQAREILPGGPSQLSDTTVRPYESYKPALIFFALIHSFYTIMFKNVTKEEEWSLSVAEHIRNNDQQMSEATSKLLAFYQDDILPCGSFAEFCDVCGLLESIPDPDTFLSAAFTTQSQPTS